MGQETQKALIGTSGYSYSHWWDGVFYPADVPQKKWLEFYANSFDTVELNVSFYRLPKRETFDGWRKRTPASFVFAVKGSRFITHIKKLKDCQEPLSLFFDHAGALGEKLGCVLWQLPPNLHADRDKLAGFCKLLKRADVPKGTRQAFEFRHQSWFTEEIYQVLRENNFSLCIAHSTRWPYQEVTTADFIYLRFHGGEVLYGSNYSDKELAEWASKARRWLGEGKDIFAYFNNDAHGYAVDNAIKLRTLIEKGEMV